MWDYLKICEDILKPLSAKQKKIIARRFALLGFKEKETLEAIGHDFGITRERVRQIIRDGLSKIKPLANYQKLFSQFKNHLRKFGGLRKEEKLLAELANGEFQNEIYFLLTICPDFKRIKETPEYYSLWTIDEASWHLAQKIIKTVCEKFKKIGQPLKLEELNKDFSISKKTLISYLEISKHLKQNEEGFWGLIDWPEINPRRIRDKIYVTFKKIQKPLHFAQLAQLIGHNVPQTVHNELIKDNRFVLVGRGLYALREWGYEEGFVKDIIWKVLKEAGRPLTKNEIVEKVLKQRLVKKNTILLNLNNKNYFSKTSDGYYTIREA